MQSAPITRAFDSLTDYRLALADLVDGAQRELLIFDSDLRDMGLESRDAIDRLKRLLAASRQSVVRIAVHNSGYFERECPRLFQLYVLYRHAMEVRRVPENLRHLTECFAVADGTHLAVRFHMDHSRGKLVMCDPDEVGGWRRRFQDLWEACGDAVSAARLGL